MIRTVLFAAIILANALFIGRFILDIARHWKETFAETGSSPFYAVLGFVTMFLATLGISDYAINAIVYRKTGYVEDRLIPPTLNTECTIPLLIMALAYISTVECDPLTLVVLIATQTAGAFLSPRLVARLNAGTIRLTMGVGLAFGAFMILLKLVGLFPSTGTLIGFTGWKLVVAAVALFIFGALNNVGIGSMAPTMAVCYALGLNPLVAYPIMMGACTCSIALGSSEFVRLENYARKPTLWFAITGSAGAALASFAVKSLDLTWLTWLVMFVIFYASFDLLKNEVKARSDAKAAQTATTAEAH